MPYIFISPYIRISERNNKKLKNYNNEPFATPLQINIPLPSLSLKLMFDNITNADLMISGSSSSVANWNTFFDLPTNGNPFTSVSVVGNDVELLGGFGITLKDSLFGSNSNSINLLGIIDTGCIIIANYDAFGNRVGSGCINMTTAYLPAITTIGQYCFIHCESLIYTNFSALTTLGNNSIMFCTNLISLDFPVLTIMNENGCIRSCPNLLYVNLPVLTTMAGYQFQACTGLTSISLPVLNTLGNYCFQLCTSLTSINLPSCTTLGTTTGNNNVFLSIINNNISLTIPSALMTCNGGSPDGDIQYLQANNTVTIIQL